MPPPRQHSSRRGQTWITETLGFRVFALTATAGLALALWLTWASVSLSALHTIETRSTDNTVAGRVVSCGTELLAPPCTVEFTAPSGRQTQQPLSRAHLVGVSEGQDLSLWLSDDGAVTVAGWRLWTDVAVLLLLAVALSVWSVRHLAALLRYGDPRGALSLRDLAPPRPSTRLRRGERTQRRREG